MSPELYLAFVVATVIALVVPGPTILLVVSYALARGRNVTLALVSGVILGDLIAMSVTLDSQQCGFITHLQRYFFLKSIFKIC